MRRFHRKLEWYSLTKKQNMSEKFMIEFKHKIKWMLIFINKKVSEHVIIQYHNYWVRKHNYYDRQMWNYICEYQDLSEGFIIYNKKLVNWELILEHQDISEGFIYKYYYGK